MLFPVSSVVFYKFEDWLNFKFFRNLFGCW